MMLLLITQISSLIAKEYRVRVIIKSNKYGNNERVDSLKQNKNPITPTTTDDDVILQ